MTTPVVTAERLTLVVRRALEAPCARPVEWSLEPLEVELINPLTAGLYRVVGTAQVGQGTLRSWRLVMKVTARRDFTGTPLESGYSELPQDWNYWRREVLAYRSGVLDRFTWPLRPARCWGTDDIDDTTTWIWLEELGAPCARPRWPLGELAASAYDWGAFAAQGLAMAGEVERLPWAARAWLRGWVATARGMGGDHAMAHEGCWSHDLLRDRLPPSAHATYAELLRRADTLLARLDALPRTVAHHDTQWTNLFSETGPQGRRTVAIDWSCLGTGAVGEDLGHHIASNLFRASVAPGDAAEHEKTATRAYLAGLRAYGWHGDDEDVRFAGAATGSLQMLSLAACFIARLCPEFGEVQRWPEQIAEKQSCDVDEVMDAWCETFRYLLTPAERAMRHVAGD